MLKKIQLECNGKTPQEIKELNLDNKRTTGKVEGLTDEFTGLEVLSMNNVGLTSLDGFPSLPNLQRLELSDNSISGKLDKLVGCPAITHLNLSGNTIKGIEALEPLSGMKELKVLDLYKCDVTNEESYREKVFKMIPQLSYLDGFDKFNKEALDSEGEDGDAEEDESGEDVSDDDSDNEVGLDYIYQKDLNDENDESDSDYDALDEKVEADESDSGEDSDKDASTSKPTKRKIEASGEEEHAPEKICKSDEQETSN